MASEQQVDLKALSGSLSNSYSSLLQHTSLTKEQVIHHLDQLSTYSSHLHLLGTLLVLEAQFEQDNDVKGLDPIFNLLSVWTRRLSGAATPDVTEKASLLTTVLTLFSEKLLSLDVFDVATLPIRKNAWLGLVAFVGCSPKSFDEEHLLTAMTKVVQFYTQKQQNGDTSMVETLEAGVAHALAGSTSLNVFEMDHCQQLLESLIRLETHRFPEGSWSIALLLEHAVDIRSKLEPTTRAEADIDTLYSLAENILEKQKESPDDLPAYFSKVAVIAGIVRMLQFNQGQKTTKIQEISQKAQELFITHFNNLLQQSMDRHQTASFSLNQDTLAYFSGQCLPNMPVKIMKSLDSKALLQVLISFYSTSDRLWKEGQIIRGLKDDTVLVELQKNTLYKEIGRISRAIGKVIQVLLEQDVQGGPEAIQSSIDRLDGLSYNVFIDWDQYTAEHEGTTKTGDEQKLYNNVESNMWAIFKTMVFAYTAILKSVAVDVADGQGLIQVPHAVQGILSIYANLNFINEKLGSANGFQAYQETLTNSVAYLKHDDNKCQLNKLMSLAFREYGSNSYTSDQTPSTNIISHIQRCRLLFFMNLAEQVMPELDEQVLEQDILPVIYPILKWKTIIDKDLYESAHAATLSIFSAQKPVSRELAGGYASILINNFPEPLTHHQIRLAYVTMVQSLCELDDSVAWLTVQHVLEKINQLQDDETATTLRSEYLVLLIDLLKPLSLGPFFSKALVIVEKLIKKQETKGMRQSTLKIVYETISGSGISDMRKVEAVGWYLELKRQLSL
ncbi:hypothetical protein BCR42DRAFT_427873 [Absidia repens]|uniref:Uncharacterized protein n=1 Tax=Absidia repens TaxID=90262 RepID=A0A1X2HZ65_9FUNG|nr:hypothetical protein BCR42DRAFT_427873 [Absidia repens]